MSIIFGRRGSATGSAVAGEPAFFAALADLQWGLLNTSTFDSVVDPLAFTTNANGGGANPVSHITTDWGCLAVDRISGQIWMVGGGHSPGYAGNEPYGLNAKTSRTPVRYRDATAAQGGGSGTWEIWTSDSRRGSGHSYQTLVAANGRIFALGCHGSCYVGSTDSNTLWEFKIGTQGNDNTNNDWVNHGSLLDTSQSTADQTGFHDPLHQHLVVIGATNGLSSKGVQVFDVSGAPGVTPTLVSSNSGQSYNNSNTWTCAFDETNRIMLQSSTTGMNWMKKDALGDFTALSQSGATTINEEHGFDWHGPSLAYITYKTGTLYKLKPTVSGGNYTGMVSSVVGGVTGLTPPAPDGTLNGRIKIINDMGAGRSALIYMPTWANGIYIMPLPVAGV